MALCDEGYLCEVCGAEVVDLRDSDLYLRFALGEVDPETLHHAPERHLRCNPTLAQFIVDPEFEPVCLDGAFAKANLDPEFVRSEEERVSRAYRTLLRLYTSSRRTPIRDYLPAELRRRWDTEPSSDR